MSTKSQYYSKKVEADIIEFSDNDTEGQIEVEIPKNLSLFDIVKLIADFHKTHIEAYNRATQQERTIRKEMAQDVKQEQQKRVEELEQQIAALKSRP